MNLRSHLDSMQRNEMRELVAGHRREVDVMHTEHELLKGAF
jgi:hypothetical protein